ncbi:DMT family transporter [Pelagibacterales bacterium SAG-MED41]|nr:DMT family transporter [Pelagibacterales bacterium SAG-MED41]
MRNSSYFPYLLLFVQPIFMATNIIVARGGVEYVPPISLAFWRWLTVFLILFPFFYNEILKNKKSFNKEFWKLFFLGSMGCGVCGAFPFIAGMSTTMANMGIIYTSSPIFIIILSAMFFNDKINFSRIIGLVLCLIGVLTIISKGNLDLLINFKFTSGDLWMIGAAMGWAVYSIYLLNWKSKFSLMARFTLIAMFGTISLFPFYILEEIFYLNTAFNSNFLFWVLFAAVSPGIIAFTLYTRVQKYLGASLTGFTLYIFSIYSAIYGIILFDEALLNFHYFGAAFVFAGVYLARKITS